MAALVAMLVIAISPVQVFAAGHDGTAQTRTATRTVVGERYVPTIWVDPDGCEHWVMDDGAEGYMTPRVTRDGKPVCRRAVLCGVMPTDQFFPTNGARITNTGLQNLRNFFADAGARGYIISGHTDSRGPDEFNLRLSKKRAEAVARLARKAGANVMEIRGYGERQPRASNGTAEGMAQNRRVEIICVN